MEGLTTDERYAEAVRSVRMFLEGRHKDLAQELRARVEAASLDQRYEEAAAVHDLARTVEELGEKQKMASTEGGDTDIFAYYAELPLIAVNLFHLRNGHIVDRREFFWEDVREFDPAEFFSSLLKQVYLDDPYVPAVIHVPVEFEEREVLEEFLSEKRGRKVEIHTPQRGPEEGHAGAGGIQRAAQFRAAVPRAEADLEGDFRRPCRTRWAWKTRRTGLNASIFRTFRGPTKSPAWWCGKTGG